MATILNNKNNPSALSTAYLEKADNAIAAMTGSAQSGAGSMAQAHAVAAKSSAEKASQSINKTAGVMSGVADAMLPGADRIAADAATLRAAGVESTNLAQGWLQQSKGLLSMDEGAGGISGEFAGLYKKLDPNLQMTLAAGDARLEAQSQTDAAVRALQRAGVSPTASAVASVRQKMAERTSALVASVKTQARQAGINMQMAALEKGLTMAIQQAGVGETFLRDAATNTAAAVTAEQAGAAVQQAAGSLYGASATLVADAQNLIQAAANGITSASAQRIAEAQAVVNAFATAAEYYSTQASSFRGLAEEGSSIV